MYLKNNIRGFTLVELAIVLVVIGLLMGMAFKGKALVDATRYKADINKIEKLSTALNVYHSKYGTIPGLGAAASNGGATVRSMYDMLINEGLVKDSDFKLTVLSGQWMHFIGCDSATDTWAFGDLTEQANICIYITDKDPKTLDVKSESYWINSSVTPAFACQVETLLDDKNLKTGDGRGATYGGGGSGGGAVEVDPSFDCAHPKGKNGNYLYRVF